MSMDSGLSEVPGSSTKTKKMLFGGIEAGGTSFLVSVAENDPANIVYEKRVKTQDPKTTLAAVVDALKDFDLAAVGIASFGPIDVDPLSVTYGHITTTPKRLWRHFDLLGTVRDAFPGLPVGFQTDVNAAALAELEYGQHHSCASGAVSCNGRRVERKCREKGHRRTPSKSPARPVRTLAYVTVGTGVGVGIVVDGRFVPGLLHGEGGHIPIRRHDSDDTFKGVCPFHGDCLEGLTTAPAIAARLGVSQDQLPFVSDDNPVWEVVAHNIAQLCLVLLYTLSCDVIVLGGGVFQRHSLFDKVRRVVAERLGGYLVHPVLKYESPNKEGEGEKKQSGSGQGAQQESEPTKKESCGLHNYIVPSPLNAKGRRGTSGSVGACLLAKHALKRQVSTSSL